VAQDFFGVAEATPCHPGRTATATVLRTDVNAQISIASAVRNWRSTSSWLRRSVPANKNLRLHSWWEDSWTAKLYSLGSGSWLAWASGTTVQTIGPTMQH